jgi:arylsulfatase A-like enzyme
LVISFVNPHDVYVLQYNIETAGYSENDMYHIHVPLLDNCFENLKAQNKPRAQECMSWNQVHHEHNMQAFINFYAHLHTIVDSHIGQVLKTLDDLQMTKNTLVIWFADHGEQALSHGLVEKFYDAYDKSMHIPLIISNPQVYTSAQSNDALVSLLDIIPTIADLLGVATEFPGQFFGSSLVPILNNNNDFDVLARKDEVIHFCYDYIPAKTGVPSIIRCVWT